MRRTSVAAGIAGLLVLAILFIARLWMRPPSWRELPRVYSLQKKTPAIPVEPADAPAPKRVLSGEADADFLKIHAAFLARENSGPIRLLFLGDSITYLWCSQGRASWNRYFGKFDPVNFAVGGERTQHLLWEIQNGLLDHVHPRLVVLAIGTNNTDYPAESIIKGVHRIVGEIRTRLPESKLLVLGILPRDWPWEPAWEKIRTVNADLGKLDDGQSVRFLDSTKVFLLPKGTIDSGMMPDTLHLNATGYRAWAEFMVPVIEQMMK